MCVGIFHESNCWFFTHLLSGAIFPAASRLSSPSPPCSDSAAPRPGATAPSGAPTARRRHAPARRSRSGAAQRRHADGPREGGNHWGMG